MTSPATGYFAPDDPLSAYRPELVMLPAQARHQALAATAEPGTEERHAVRNVVVLTLAAILALRGLDWLRQAKKWEDHGRFDPTSFDRDISRAFQQRVASGLVPVLSGMLLLGRNTVAETLGIGATGRAATTAVADKWARAYASTVARDYAATSAHSIAVALPDWLSRNLPAAAMASRARDLYGLDPRAANAVARYGTGKAAGPALNSRALIERYLEHRAKINASVYTMAAQNAGREMLFTEMVEAGLIPASTKKVWVTAHDERVCPICGPMDGVAVRLGQRFHVGGSHLVTAPVHPLCRCTLALDVTPHEGFVFPKRYDLMTHWVDSAIRSVFG